MLGSVVVVGEDRGVVGVAVGVDECDVLFVGVDANDVEYGVEDLVGIDGHFWCDVI